jgi:hypothetical protein
MSTKSREIIVGSWIAGGKIRAQAARERAEEAIREADRAEAEAWSIRMEGYGGPAQPPPTIAQCLMVVRVGCRSNAVAAKPRPVFRLNTSDGRGIRRFGSLRRR